MTLPSTLLHSPLTPLALLMQHHYPPYFTNLPLYPPFLLPSNLLVSPPLHPSRHYLWEHFNPPPLPLLRYPHRPVFFILPTQLQNLPSLPVTPFLVTALVSKHLPTLSPPVLSPPSNYFIATLSPLHFHLPPPVYHPPLLICLYPPASLGSWHPSSSPVFSTHAASLTPSLPAPMNTAPRINSTLFNILLQFLIGTLLISQTPAPPTSFNIFNCHPPLPGIKHLSNTSTRLIIPSFMTTK